MLGSQSAVWLVEEDFPSQQPSMELVRNATVSIGLAMKIQNTVQIIILL